MPTENPKLVLDIGIPTYLRLMHAAQLTLIVERALEHGIDDDHEAPIVLPADMAEALRMMLGCIRDALDAGSGDPALLRAHHNASHELNGATA